MTSEEREKIRVVVDKMGRIRERLYMINELQNKDVETFLAIRNLFAVNYKLGPDSKFKDEFDGLIKKYEKRLREELEKLENQLAKL